MADRGRGRRGAPKRALIGPLVLLAGGVAASAALWRFLMLESSPPGAVQLSVPEHLSSGDRQALDRVLGNRVAH